MQNHFTLHFSEHIYFDFCWFSFDSQKFSVFPPAVSPRFVVAVSLHYVCTKHQRLHTVKDAAITYEARVDYSHAFGQCNKSNLGAFCTAVGFSP